ncbi:MAG: hypothetical protein QOJ72_191 [Nocardioidaceae bacterium]|jgi:hypothetical protein|nr:hypothetical protein [Nocardioidaceae bacterium]
MSKGVVVLASSVALVVVVSVVLGLTSPDGSVGESSKPKAAATRTSAPTPTPTPTATKRAADKPSAALAPRSVRGTWPGRPKAAHLKHGKVDWCPAVHISGSASASTVFGDPATKAGACAAVRFVFEQRYSRLAIPRKSYRSSDFGFVRSALSSSTGSGAYQARVNTFVAAPANAAARGALGIVLFSGAGTPAGAKHASAGLDRVFYGKAFTTKGYAHRAAWIDPSWSTVTVSVDRARVAPRLVATFTATASMPVFNTRTHQDEMITVPTNATFTLVRSGSTWKVDTWTITSHSSSFAPLKIRKR